MTRYSKGAAFENAVKHDLERRGYAAVRVAGSHSPADVWAVNRRLILFVQCKTNGVLRPDEWNEFFDYCVTWGTLPVMANKDGGKVVYHLLTAKKDGTHRKQPMEDFQP